MQTLSQERSPATLGNEKAERAYLVGVILPGDEEHAEEYLQELRSLAETAGAVVKGVAVQRRSVPDKTSFMGKGKAMEVAHEASRHDATLLILDNDLSPAQARNLEEITGLRVVERSQLIMDIFAAGAQTLQARKQVELAQLQYFLPRLKRLWTHLSRIRSGIGMRGPGETQLEVDRRIVRRKIGELQRELKGFEKRKRLELDSRKSCFKVCLVGYTNSGKSTLLNRLTGARVKAENRLFSTLDTRTRRWALSKNLKVLLSDTVGFIRKLPHHLVASFHATLEEALTADLLIHVLDCSHPGALRHIEAVNQVLEDIGAAHVPRLLVLNKMDCITDFMEVGHLRNACGKHVLLSAKEGSGLDELTRCVQEQLIATYAEVQVDMPASAGRLQAYLARVGDVVVSRHRNGRHYVTARLPRFEMGRLRKLVSAHKAELRGDSSES